MFLTSRKPGHAVASGDLCPVTRRARLSYRRPAESFERATRPLANPSASHEELEEVHGWTLHQLPGIRSQLLKVNAYVAPRGA